MREQVAEPNRSTPVRVYLLHDHELTRRGVRDLLREVDDVDLVGESGLAAGAARAVLASAPDVAVLATRLPDGSGIEVCRRVRSADPSLPVVMLTCHDDDEALFAAIAAGAAGYLLTRIRGDDFVDAVRRVAAGQSLLDPVVTTHVLERLRNGTPLADTTAQLTPKEGDVLDLIGEGLTNRQIGVRLGLAEKTVKNHVSSVLAKLEVESRTQAAIIATRRRASGGL